MITKAREELKNIQQRLEAITQDNSLGKHEKVLEYRELKFQEEWFTGLIKRLEHEALLTKRKSAIGERFATRTFETFIPLENQEALEITKSYAEDFLNIQRNDKNSLIIVGDYGTGKTHLAAAISNYIIDNYKLGVLFNTWAGHLNEIKKSYEGGKTRIEDLVKADLLVIDDFGKEKPTEWNQEVLFEVINSRYENNMPVVITTNLKGKEADEHMGKAVQSRLIEMCEFVRMKGKDHRI